MSKEKKVYILVQEGGSSYEHYVHAWDTPEEAEQDRIDCSRDGSYATTPVMEVSAELANQPEFYEVLELVIRSLQDLEVVNVPEEEQE